MKRLLASYVPAVGVALVLAAACLWGLLAGSRARMGDLLFAARPADLLIVGTDNGIRTI